VATAYQKFEVGSKIYHEDYGEGMVVEVSPRQFFDILSVAFEDGVKRLNSNHPKISDQPFAPSAPPSERPPESVPTARKNSRRGKGTARPKRRRGTTGSSPAASKGADPGAEVVDSADDASPSRFAFSGTPMLHLDVDSVERIAAQTAPSDESGQAFLHQLVAQRSSLTRGFQKLISLTATRDLEQYDFQIHAVQRVLRHMRGRAILADEVGLGKTIEAGLVLKEYVLRGLVRKALILTPVSLISQWREELRHKFDLPFEIRSRSMRWDAHPFVIASLDTAKTENNREEIGQAGFDLLIVDEAHRLRNHLTQGWKFVDALSLKYLLLLTATPVQNDLRELYNLVTLLKPGHLGTYRAFRTQFMVRGDKRLPKDPTKLAATLTQVMVRTSRSSTSLTFPKREVRIREFEMSTEERKLYDDTSRFIREVLDDVEIKDRSRWHFLLLLLQKEMGSSAPAAVRTLERAERVFRGTPIGRKLKRLVSVGQQIDTHAKRDGLIELVAEDSSEKFLVFTQFRRTLEFLEQGLLEAGERPALFHGSLSLKEKDAVIEKFRGKTRILLSTEAGGEGRNLQFCRNVVNYDLPWNPMRIEQRIGRVHRLGQTRDTRIWNFTARNTVEAYVLSILHEKIQMFELVIGEMDMVLGQWPDRDGFEQEVFKIWTNNRTVRSREKAFDELAEDLQLAQQRYERIQDFDEKVFSRLEHSSEVK